MIAVLLATLAATLTATGAWALDQWFLRCGTVFRAAVATGLMALSTWIGTLIHAAIWLKTPGAYGPVQFWSSDEAAMAFMSGPRALSLFLIFWGFLFAAVLAVASIVSLLFPCVGFWRRWYRLVVPVLTIAAYALACHWFVTYEFFPSA